MKLLPAYFASFFISVTTGAQSLSGHIFELGSDKKDCAIFGECDCCTSEIFFIDENRFALIDYCVTESVVTTGTYRASALELLLTFAQLSVTSGMDYETDSAGKPFVRREVMELKPMKFSIARCEDDSTMLENAEINNYSYGLRTADEGEASRIRHLLDSQEWKEVSKPGR